MAISKLGGNADKWVEIATSSPTSGTTVSFTSIPEYKDLAVWAYNINNSTATTLTVRLNNDSGTNYTRAALYQNTYAQIVNERLQTAIYGTRGNSTVNGFQLTIEGANSPFKIITGRSFDTTGFNTIGTWNSADTITQIDVISTATFDAGTIKLFGRN